jgi:hypothetical protein
LQSNGSIKTGTNHAFAQARFAGDELYCAGKPGNTLPRQRRHTDCPKIPACTFAARRASLTSLHRHRLAENSRSAERAYSGEGS